MCEVLNFIKKFPRENNGPITHTIIGEGSFNLSQENTLKLYKYINREKNRGKPVPSILERIQPISRLVLDLDFKYKDEFSERQYNDEFIEKMYSYILNNLTKIFALTSEEQKEMWVFEKENILPATQIGYKSKDGLHLQFPNIISDTKNYSKLIDLIYASSDEFYKIMDETCLSRPSNDIKHIFDSAPYKNGNWYVNGCGKKDEPFIYELTNIYQYNGNNITNIDIDDYLDSPLEIMKKNSMFLNIDKNVSYIDDVEDNDTLFKANTNNNIVKMEIYEFENVDNKNRIVGNDRNFIDSLVNLTSSNRADDYNEWINMGYNIHSLSRTEFGYNLWIKFSKKSNKFDKNVCDKQWAYMDRTAKDNVTLGSLIYKAKHDNPEGYENLRRDTLEEFVRKTILKEKSCGSHTDVAELVGKYYRDEFVCADLKEESWYYFSPELGKWKKTQKGYELRKRLSSDIIEIYEYYAKKYKALRGDDPDSEDYEKYDKYNSNCHKVILKLKDGPYKDKIMKECKEKFYQEEFLEKINTKLNLFALKNCVIDLKYEEEDQTKIIFREGLPEDYITISSGYDLPIERKDLPMDMDTAFNKVLNRLGDEERVKLDDLDDFLNKILPVEDVREYTLRFLSSCLSGEVPVHKFNMWTGSGGNGKSMLVKLMNYALGDYAKTMDVSYITKERGGSSAASPEIELIKFARFVPMSEPEKQDSIYAGKLKHITGGDTMTSRGLFKETTEFKPQFKMMLMCNDLPTIPNVDGGVARRIEVVDFISKFEDDPQPTSNDPYVYKKDPTLEDKLKDWVLVFLFKLLDYYPKFVKFISDNSKPPESVTKATKVYLTENDLLQKWIMDDITICSQTYSLNTLHNTFMAWCDNEGSNHKKVEKKDIKKAFEELQRKSHYGLVYGNKKSDNAPNGTKPYPMFNFCSKIDLDD